MSNLFGNFIIASRVIHRMFQGIFDVYRLFAMTYVIFRLCM